jgi:hypothetical protein
MATINPVITRIGDHTLKFLYSPMTNAGADVGAPIGPNHADFADRNVQVFGNFGAGGTLLVEGSSDSGTTYATLNDQSDNAISLTTAKNEQIVSNPELTRPRVSAGDGTTSLTAVILCRRTQRSK